MKKTSQELMSRKLLVGKNGLVWQSGVTFVTLLKKAIAKSKKIQLPILAGSLAFTTVLSLIPLLAVLFYVFMLIGGLQFAYEKLLPFLLENLSEGSGASVKEHLGNFVHQVHSHTVGWVGITGLVITALLTYLRVVSAFNLIWGIEQPKSFQRRVIRGLTVLTIGPFLMTASIALTTAVAAQVKGLLWSGHLVAFALSAMLYSLLYGLVPMVKVPPRVILLGSMLPAALWEMAKSAYAIYTHRMVTYSNFYGAFAAIPLFLIWIYIAWLITLFGGVWVYTLQLYFEKKE